MPLSMPGSCFVKGSTVTLNTCTDKGQDGRMLKWYYPGGLGTPETITLTPAMAHVLTVMGKFCIHI